MSSRFTVKRKEWSSPDTESEINFDDLKDGQFYVGKGGEVRRHYKGAPDPLVIAPKGFPTTQKNKVADTRDKRGELNRLKFLIRMRDLKRDILNLQVEYTDDDIAHLPEAPWAKSQKELRETYDAFHKTFGPLNDFELRDTGHVKDHGEPTIYKFYTNLRKFRRDPDAYIVAALEEYDHITDHVTLDPIFTERVVRPRQKTFNIKSLKEALGICLDQKGAVDIAYMTSLYGAANDEEMLRKLKQQNLIYFDPQEDAWIEAQEYLSGFIDEKIAAVQGVIGDMLDLKRNLTALEEVLPDDLEPSDIMISLGVPWIPADVIEDFAQEVLGLGETEVVYIPEKHGWFVKHLDDPDLAKFSGFSTEFVRADRILKACLNKGDITVTRTKDKYDHDIDAGFETNLASDKQAEMEDAFREWIWKDADRAARLGKIYNHFNALVPRQEFDGTYLSLPGSSLSVDLRPHQQSAVWRNIQYGNTLYEHATGSGKTYTAIAASMKLMALGKAEKPLLNVPNSMVGEFARAFQKFYPHANVLVIEPDEMLEDSGKMTIHEKMQSVMGRIQNHRGPVIMSHANYDRFEVSLALRLQRLLEYARESKSLADAHDFGTVNTMFKKAIEEVAEFLDAGNVLMSARDLKDLVEENLDKDPEDEIWATFLDQIDRGEVLNFEQTGIDYIFTDEGHGYKNIDINSRFDGLSNFGSAKTIKYEEKLEYLRRKKGDFYHTLMSWTPISNSIAEVYTMQKFLDPDLIEDMGFACFDAWAHMFCKTTESVEIAPEGGFRAVERISEYQNLPELIRMYLTVSDIVPDEMLDLVKPALKGGKEKTVTIPQSDDLQEFLRELAQRAMRVRNGSVSHKEDNLLKIMNEGILATLHPALVGLPYDEDSTNKIDVIADEVAKRYRKNKDNIYHNEKGEPDPVAGALQMVLCDLGIAKSGDQFSAYDDLKEKLVARGVPAGKIQFIHDHTSATKEREIQRKCNDGEVAVIIGTTAKLGTGKNMQKRLIALHQALMLWRPSDDDQGKGRIDRQGNQNKEVEILRYIVENSPDGYRWQTLARKSRFINQIKSKDLDTRNAPESSQTLGYNEVVASVLNDPLVFETVEISQELSRLERAKEAHKQQVKRARKALPKLRTQIKEEEAATLHLRAAFNAMARYQEKNSGFVMNRQTFETEAQAGEALKQKLRAVRDDLREKRSVSVQNLGTLYGYKIHLQAESEVDVKSSTKDSTPKSYKYRFVLKIDAPEKFEISMTSNDIRLTEAERLFVKGAADNDNDVSVDLDALAHDVTNFDQALFNKLAAPFQKIKDEVQAVNDGVQRLNAERHRLTSITKQRFALSEDIGRLKDRQKQIRKMLKSRAKEDGETARALMMHNL